MTGWSLTAMAQVPPLVCVTPPAQVEGLEGGPTWFPGAAAAGLAVRPELDDPRWAGGPLTPFQGSGGMGAPLFRMVRDGKYLSVSVHAPVSVSGSDTVYFGFSLGNTASKSAYLLPIAPMPASAASADPIPTPVTHYYEYCGGSQCPLLPGTPAGTVNTCPAGWCARAVPPPPWLVDVATFRSSETGLDFGLNFKIRYAGGAPAEVAAIPLTLQFRMFLGLGLNLTSGVVQYSVPLIPAGTVSWVDPAIHVPRDFWTAWGKFDGLGKECQRGVTVDALDIATSSVDSDTNSFRVTARNITGQEVPANHMLKSTLRSAEWGAVACDPDAAWDPLPSTPPTWSWQWSGGAAPIKPKTGSATMSFTCNFTSPADPSCPSVASTAGGSGGAMRSLLASVEPGVTGQHLLFSVPSAYRNIAFASLSQMEQTATISIKGLEKITGKKVAKRDVFLQVKRRNMRSHGRAPMELPLKEMKRIQRFVANPPPSPFDEPTPLNDVLYDVKTAVPAQKTVTTAPSKANLPPLKQSAEPKDPVSQQTPEPQPPRFEEIPLEYSSAARIELLNRVWPAYEVHAFYDTGETMVVNGKPQKVFKALMPFAYLLQHEGPFFGFTDALMHEDGKPLEQVGPDLYRVSIPAEGSVKIKTRISAEEVPLGSDCTQCKPPVVNVNLRGCHCRAVGGAAEERGLLPLALLPVVAFFARRSRSQRERRERGVS